jgi:asparagine N-glycosylation enzyme membrane subunit Stt3
MISYLCIYIFCLLWEKLSGINLITSGSPFYLLVEFIFLPNWVKRAALHSYFIQMLILSFSKVRFLIYGSSILLVAKAISHCAFSERNLFHDYLLVLGVGDHQIAP